MIKRCVECWADIKVQDTPGISYIAFCQECGWNDDHDYYVNPKNGKTELMDKKSALENGAIFLCGDCGCDIMPWENKSYNGLCIFCKDN